MNVVNRCEDCGKAYQHVRGDGVATCGRCVELGPTTTRTQERDKLLASTPLHKLYPEMTEGLARLQEQRPSAEAWKARSV